MTKQLIFFDIDGTILDERFRIPPSAAQAIARAHENGVLCVINSGRPFAHIEPAIKAMPFDGYVCSCGQHILLNGRLLCHIAPEPELCLRVVELVRDCRLDVIYEGEGGIWFDPTRPMRPEIRSGCTHFRERGFDVDAPIDGPDFRFDKLCVYVNPDCDFDRFRREMEPHFTFIDREGDLFELVVRGCSKEEGIRRVIREAGIPLEHCYAIGDGANDVPMLRCVPHSIAMGNAPDFVRAMCEYVTAPLHEDGLARALAHYNLI